MKITFKKDLKYMKKTNNWESLFHIREMDI
jgi:hypothetical protein